jgi:hypothetical protein
MEERSSVMERLERRSLRTTIIVFRKSDGSIVHRHDTLTLPGGVAPPDAETDAHALTIARRHVGEEEELGLVRVPSDAFKMGVEQKIDVEREVLVESSPSS